MKKALSLILALVMLVSCLPATALHAHAAEFVQLEPVTKSYINPLYANVPDAEHTVQMQTYDAPVSTVACADEAEAVAHMRQQMKQRSPSVSFSISLKEGDPDLADRVFEKAVAHTGVPTEGDYLLWQFDRWSCSISGYTDRNGYHLTYTYDLFYHTTAQQEAERLNYYFHADFLSNDRALEGAFDGTYTIFQFLSYTHNPVTFL